MAFIGYTHSESLSFTYYLSASIFLCLLVFVARTIYSAYRSPLSKLPGPSLARFSSLWRIKTAASGNAPIIYQELHKKYGSVVRTGPNHVSVSDPAQIPVIYGISSKFMKSKFYNVFVPMIEGKKYPNFFTFQDNTSHRIQKSTIAQKYSLSSLLSLEPLVDNVTRSFITALHDLETASQSPTTKLDLGTWVQYYAFDVIGAITFSRTFDFISSGTDAKGVLPGLEGGLIYGAVVGQIPWLHDWLLGSKFVQKMFRKIPAIAKHNPVPILDEMIQDQLSTRLMNPDQTSTREDFITFMTKQNLKDPGQMTEDLMKTHLIANLLAGSDTTAISVRTIFYFLMKTPRVYTKLQSQIDKADEAGLLSPLVTYAEVQAHIPFLAQIIKETLRLHPAVALPLERLVPQDGMSIGNYSIPPGTNIGINAWVIHYDPKTFGDDAGDFVPERWEDESSGRVKAMDRSFFAFGYGSRACSGKNISLMEMSKLVPQILRDFEISWDGDGSPEWEVHSSWFAKQKGMIVNFKSRPRARG